jgi:hypothetical protein
MSTDELKRKLVELSSAERNQILAYLISLRDREDPEYMAKMARKIDDKDPSHWLTLEEFDRRLGLRDNKRPE